MDARIITFFIAIEKEEKYVKAIEKRVAIKHKKQTLLSRGCSTGDIIHLANLL
jgi:hypothetical protein